MAQTFDELGEPAAERLAAGLAKIGLLLRSRAWKSAGPTGVTPTQAQLLGAIQEHPQGLRLAALANIVGVSAPTASEAVNTLVGKGLVERKPGADKRSVTLTLTKEGAALAAQAGEWPAFLARAVEALAPDDQAAMLRALTTILRTLQQNGDIPAQRMCVTCRYFRPFAHKDGVQPHHCDFVDAPFGDRNLRLECKDQQAADDNAADANWRRFSAGRAA